MRSDAKRGQPKHSKPVWGSTLAGTGHARLTPPFSGTRPAFRRGVSLCRPRTGGCFCVAAVLVTTTSAGPGRPARCTRGKLTTGSRLGGGGRHRRQRRHPVHADHHRHRRQGRADRFSPRRTAEGPGAVVDRRVGEGPRHGGKPWWPATTTSTTRSSSFDPAKVTPVAQLRWLHDQRHRTGTRPFGQVACKQGRTTGNSCGVHVGPGSRPGHHRHAGVADNRGGLRRPGYRRQTCWSG